MKNLIRIGGFGGMVRRRASIAIVFLMLIVQVAYSIGFTSQATAAGIETDRNIITSVSMAVYGPDGQTVTDNVYDVDSTVSLDYTWALPDGHGYVSGDTFTFLLPEQFQLYNDIGGTLVSDDGEVGSFTVSQSTHQVVMTFNSYIESHANVHGTLRINTKFDKTVIPGSGVEEILFPVNGGTQSVVVSFKPQVGSAIEKKGASSGYNASSIQWTVDVNKKLEAVKNAAVTDPIPAGLSLDSTVTVAVYALTVQLDGSAVQGAPLDSSRYTAEIRDGALQLHFTDPVITSAYRIAYSTPIVSDHQSTFTNTATFTGDGRDPASSSATVTVERGGTLKKISEGYDWNHQTISWAIEYNYNSKSIPQENAVLTDLFDASHELIADSLKVYPVTLDSSANATKGPALTENVDYTVTNIADSGKKGFKLQFTNGVNTPHRIEYKIKAADRVFKDTTITNTVTEGTYSSTATQLVRPAIIFKNLSVIDYKNKTTDWKITVNFDNYPMGNVVVTDSFPSGGQQFVPGSLVVKDSKGKVLDASAYTLDYKTPVEPNASFKVKFASAISGYHTITYQTQFSNDWLTGKTDNFINNARIDWIDSNEVARWTDADGLFIPRAEVKNNGFKTGSYNAAAKEITWTIGANYNGKEIADPVLTDLLAAGQTLVPGSLKVYEMNIDTKGNSTKGPELNSTAYTYAVSGSELSVEFAEKISKPYFIEFRTSLEGQLIDRVISNTAQLWDGTKKVSKALTATLEIPHGGEYIYKNGLQNGDKVDWSIAINRTQSLVKDAKIVDVPSSNQILLPDSFHLYPTVVSTGGEVSKSGPELVKDTDYTLNLITDTSGSRSFELSFKKDINTAYILEYKSLIVANTGDKLVNTVNFSGNNNVLIEKDTSKEVIVGVSSGSGTGSGERGSLTVKKADAVNEEKLLAGAIFDLYRLNGSERVLVNTLATDESGSTVFNNLWLGSYVLIEKAAPQGYVLNSSEYPVTIGSAARVNLTVLNAEEVPGPTETASPAPTASPVPTESSTPAESPAPTTTPSAAPTAGPTAAPTAVVTPGIPGGTPSSGPAGPVVPGVIVNDDEIPGGAVPSPAATPSATTTPLTPVVPGEETSVDDDIPLGGVDIGEDDIPQGGVAIEDDEIPQGTAVNNQATGTLPQTGENSPMPLYLTGAAMILAGLILSRVFRRRRDQE